MHLAILHNFLSLSEYVVLQIFYCGSHHITNPKSIKLMMYSMFVMVTSRADVRF